MLKLRRPEHEARIEIMPMIDVIFLLLTFFIYAMVLMIRAELLPMQTQQLASGEPAEPAPAITISIDRTGGLFLDRDPIAIENVLERILRKVEDRPNMVVYIAVDKRGDTDRLPTFLKLYDLLSPAGLDLRLVGPPDEDVGGEPPQLQ